VNHAIQARTKDHIDALGATLLIGFAVVLGLNQALVKIVNAGFAPVFQSGLRSACAFIPVLGFALFMQRRLSIRDGSLPWGLLNGLLFSLEFCLLFVALDYTTVARVSLFFYIMPIWVAIGAHFLIPAERLSANKLAGLILALTGVGLAFMSDLGDAGPDAWLGDLLALLGGMFWAAIALVTRVSRLSQCSAEMNLLYQLGVSTVLLLAVSPLFGEMVREPDALILGVFAFQVIVVVAIGFLLWFWILSIYPVSNMASFSLLTPVFGVFFGWMIFDDPLTLSFIGALVAVGSGIVLINRQSSSGGISKG
jgi:drug/metabolite transporter (DMT)-like permease